MKNLNLIQRFSIFLLVLGFSTSVVSCNDDDEDNTPAQQTITAIATANPDFSQLVTALTRTNLVGTLDGSGQFTVFAPTNAAFDTFFATLPAGTTVNNVDVDVLRSILLNHVIATEIKSAAIPAESYQTTLSPLNASANAPTLSMFVQKSGNVVTINGGIDNKGAVVSTADVDASNGVIHIVNRVIQRPTIKDAAVANPNFSTLTGFLVAQNLAATLDGTTGSPFTVFAPINSAFNTATTTLYNGLSSQNKTGVLLYHVVAGQNYRSNQIPTGNISTVQGQNLVITGTSIDDTGSTTNKNIVVLDVQCSNGVVHAIDNVLLPTL